jgi:hypothetical protein
MKHTVTITYEVEADHWDLALEQVMREPFRNVSDCRVKSPGKQLLHIMPSILQQALARMRATA